MLYFLCPQADSALFYFFPGERLNAAFSLIGIAVLDTGDKFVQGMRKEIEHSDPNLAT